MAEAMINEKYVQATMPTLPLPSSQQQPLHSQTQHPSSNDDKASAGPSPSLLATDTRDPSNTSHHRRKYKVNFELPPTKRSRRSVNNDIQNVISGEFKEYRICRINKNI